MRFALLLGVLTACTHGAAPHAAGAPRPAKSVVTHLARGPATVVVELEPEVPTAVLEGPFIVTTINPGSDLYVAMGKAACDEPGIVWFGYSGGGLAVADGVILCARSVRDELHVQGFSGTREPRAGE